MLDGEEGPSGRGRVQYGGVVRVGSDFDLRKGSRVFTDILVLIFGTSGPKIVYKKALRYKSDFVTVM